MLVINGMYFIVNKNILLVLIFDTIYRETYKFFELINVACLKQFSQKSNLHKHVKSVHEQVKDFKCETCLKSFSQKGNLTRHTISAHNTNKGLICEACSEGFRVLCMNI